MANSHVVIYRAANIEQAYLLKNLLEEEGIFAYVTNDNLQIAGGDLPFGTPTAPQVVVHRDDAEEAGQISHDFERRLLERWGEPARSSRGLQFGLATLFYLTTCVAVYLGVSHVTRDLPWHDMALYFTFWSMALVAVGLAFKRWGINPVRDWKQPAREDKADEEDDPQSAWPACPHCRRPRHTSCPICETAGTNFVLAYMPGEEDHRGVSTIRESHPLLVLCPMCDEPFVPTFLARCEWCGHRFADGREAPSVSLVTAPFADVNGRVWIVAGGLVLSIALVLALFAHIAAQAR